MSKNNANELSPELRERAVRLVQESHSEHPSLWATACGVVGDARLINRP